MEKHTSWLSYIAAGTTAAFGGITLEQVALFVGILTALGTFLVNWYFQWKRDKRESRQ